jgi:hypothetical protein
MRFCIAPMLFITLGASLALIFHLPIMESKGAQLFTRVAILHSVSMLSARPWEDLIGRIADTSLRCIVRASPIPTAGVLAVNLSLALSIWFLATPIHCCKLAIATTQSHTGTIRH